MQKPNIQKVVPVKKNGYVLELQLPTPEQFSSQSAQANQQQAFSSAQIYNQSPQAVSNQLQNFNSAPANLPEQELQTQSDNKAFSFRNFFNR